MLNAPDLTVFVISTGKNPNLPYCLSKLSKQISMDRVDIIHGFYPLSRAFQEMLNRCKTAFFIQIDEDMVMNDTGIFTLYNSIRKSPNDVVMTCYALIDAHLDKKIYGVKAYKYNVFKHYPYNLNVISCEMEQLERIQKAGYKIMTYGDVIGIHSPLWTEELIFNRYYDLMDKWKKYGYNWLENLTYDLSYKMSADPNDINFYAMMGAFMSRSKKDIQDREKNFVYANPDYIKVKSLRSYPHQATLYMTTKCNFKCKICNRQSENSRIEDSPDMYVGLVSKLLNDFPTINGVCICGWGEPMLSPKLKEVLGFLKERNKIVSVITNGSLLESNIDSYDGVHPSFYSVSLNAVDEMEHLVSSGVQGMFRSVLKGIEKTVKKGIPIHVSYVCDRNNIDRIMHLITILELLGVSAVYIHNLLPHYATTDELKADFENRVLTTEHKTAIENCKKHDTKGIVKKWPTLIDFSTERRNCEFPFNSIAIDGRGTYSICNSIYPASSHNGTIYDTKVWHSDYSDNVRNSFCGELPYECKYCFRNWEEM